MHLRCRVSGKLVLRQLAVTIMTQMAVHESQPDSASRVGCDPTCGRKLWCGMLLLHCGSLNAQQRTRRPRHLNPDASLRVFRNADNQADRKPVRSVDPGKNPVTVDRQRVVNSDPQPAGVIFKQGSDLRSGQSLDRTEAGGFSAL